MAMTMIVSWMEAMLATRMMVEERRMRWLEETIVVPKKEQPLVQLIEILQQRKLKQVGVLPSCASTMKAVALVVQVGFP